MDNEFKRMMTDEKKRISRALISVYHKDGLLEDIIKTLHNEGVQLVSTGGTQTFIESLGIPCETAESLTGYPSILGGRVKTLHPKIFGGILARREYDTDLRQLSEYDIPTIDLVIVDLYPFEETVASGAGEADVIEKIDIGGISLIRAAAKNYRDVTIVASRAQYAPLLELLKQGGAQTTLDDRRQFARAAFAVSSGYDAAIFRYFDADEHTAIPLNADPFWLEQALANLLDNAMREAPAGSIITLAVSQNRQETRIALHNPTRAPVPDYALPRLFERYYTLNRKENSGLGLTLVAETMHRHGGSATAENHADGLRITLRFPR